MERGVAVAGVEEGSMDDEASPTECDDVHGRAIAVS